MGLFSSSKSSANKTYNTTTNTTIRDIGFTGAQAIDLVTTLEQGSINREVIAADRAESLNQLAGRTYNQLIGGANNLVSASYSTGNNIVTASRGAGANIVTASRGAGADIISGARASASATESRANQTATTIVGDAKGLAEYFTSTAKNVAQTLTGQETDDSKLYQTVAIVAIALFGIYQGTK